MDFLKREFEALPEGMRELLMKQLEIALREARYSEESHCVMLCARIKTILDLAASYKPPQE